MMSWNLTKSESLAMRPPYASFLLASAPVCSKGLSMLFIMTIYNSSSFSIIHLYCPGATMTCLMRLNLALD
jgi:hypothetical protein